MGYPSGQREQTVNLPAYAFEGSNPSPTMPWGDLRERNPFLFAEGVHLPVTFFLFAGVAQMAERKPSKLDVAGSSPVSRLTAGDRE